MIPVAGGQLDIAVAAAQQQDGLVRKFFGHRPGVAQKGLVALVVRADPIVEDGAAVAGEGGIFAKGHRAHAIGLVKGPGHAVYVDVAAEEQRLEGK